MVYQTTLKLSGINYHHTMSRRAMSTPGALAKTQDNYLDKFISQLFQS